MDLFVLHVRLPRYRNTSLHACIHNQFVIYLLFSSFPVLQTLGLAAVKRKLFADMMDSPAGQGANDEVEFIAIVGR